MPRKRVEAVRKVSRPLAKIINLVVWIAGVLVALAVGFGMAEGTLAIPWLTNVGLGVLVIAAGWVVVLLTIIGVIMAIIDALTR